MTVNALNRIGTLRGGCLVLACAAITVEAGCAAPVYSQPVEAYPGPVAADSMVYVDTVPANIEVYPHYYYGDGYAYYVDGRWYHRGPRGWGYYRQEPGELQRQRGYAQQPTAAPPERQHVQQAPEAPRERPYGQQPRAPRPGPGVVEAQPRGQDPRRAPQSEKRPNPREEQGR